MGYSLWGLKESDTTEATGQTHTCPNRLGHGFSKRSKRRNRSVSCIDLCYYVCKIETLNRGGIISLGLSWWLSDLKKKNPPVNAENAGLILGWERSPEEGNGNPLQYSCLGNSMDRGAWRATVHRVAKSQTRLRD